jgi:hypothetical protein
VKLVHRFKKKCLPARKTNKIMSTHIIKNMKDKTPFPVLPAMSHIQSIEDLFSISCISSLLQHSIGIQIIALL